MKTWPLRLDENGSYRAGATLRITVRSFLRRRIVSFLIRFRFLHKLELLVYILFQQPPSTATSHHRSASPTRVNLFTSTPLNQSFRYSIDNRSVSPNQSVAVSKPSGNKIPDSRRRCMCSPTTHPGSFRCSLHKNVANPHGQGAATYSTNGLNMRRSAMTNSLVRIGGVEGEWVRRALTTLIRPSSHQLKRRSAYQPRPSRLSSMSKADDV
ncbi:hypothetical protein HID58_023438 [Brassica napus]|uniref:Serine-rich protein n=1 Tax=Brassica napus TaxID=3708 RepID=A0ABQ8D229_BRANA|nr:hypothetical protein HID58_023438 [Brassica napus]